MRVFYLGLLLLVFLSSCKKQKEDSSANTGNNCEISMTSVASRYKMTKLEYVSYNTGAAQDMTSLLSSCDLSGVYVFRTDSTATYFEAANCTGSSGDGSWKLEGTWLLTDFNTGNGYKVGLTTVESYDCKHLVVITRFPSVEYNYRYTLTRF